MSMSLRRSIGICIAIGLAGVVLVTCFSQRAPASAHVTVATSSSGSIALTSGANKFAVSNDLGTSFSVVDLPRDDPRGRYSYPAWSPDGKQLALTIVKDGESSIVVYDPKTTAMKPVPESKSDIAVHWITPTTLVVLRASSFDRPGRLMGPIYDGLQPLVISIGNGQAVDYKGPYLAKASPGGFYADGDWLVTSDAQSEPRRYRLRVYHQGRLLCETIDGGFHSSVGMTDSEIVALRDKGGAKAFEIVGISKADCTTRVICGSSKLESIVKRL